MNRHPFRWTGLAFGSFFLAVAGNWAVWRAELISGQELGYLVSGLLIVLGVLGVVFTLRPARSRATKPPGDEAGDATP